MKKLISKWLSILLPLLLGTFLIIYTFGSYSADQIATIQHYFRDADYLYIGISLIISLLSSASRAYRWKYSLEHMGYKTTFANNFMAVSIGYLMNMTIPRSGEFSRALIIKKYNNIPFDKGFGTIVAERIVDSLVLLLLMLIALVVQFDVVKAFILDKIPIQKALWIVTFGVIMLLVAASVYFYSKSQVVLTLKHKISGLKEGLLSIVEMDNKWPYILHTIFIWGSFIMMFYVTIFAIEDTRNLGFGAVLTSFIVGSIAIAVTSSGFGTYPVLVAKILVFYSIAEPAGTAYGWIVWTSQILLVVLLGAVSFLLLPLFNRNK